jgi:hypothetical protein
MRRHCLSRADVAAALWLTQLLCPSRYASIRTLRELTLFGGLVHYEIRLFELEALQSSERPSSWRVGQVHMAHSPYARSEAHSGKKSRVHLPL